MNILKQIIGHKLEIKWDEPEEYMDEDDNVVQEGEECVLCFPCAEGGCWGNRKKTLKEAVKSVMKCNNLKEIK